MADKVINVRINVDKIDKTALYRGEKGTYLDIAVWYNEEQSEYGDNGMVTQSISKERRDKGEKGAILGNCKEFKSSGNRESIPGSENSKSKSGAEAKSSAQEVADDLPF